MYSFPPAKPVTGGSKSGLLNENFEARNRLSLTGAADMNYVSAVYGVVVFIIVIDWLVRGKRGYRGQTLRHAEAEANLTGNETIR